MMMNRYRRWLNEKILVIQAWLKTPVFSHFYSSFCTEESAPEQVTVTHRDALRRSSDSFAFLLGATYGFCKHKMNLLDRKVRRSAKTDFDCTLSSIHVLIHSFISSDSNSAEKRSLAETETVLIESDSVKTEVVEAG